MRLALALIVVAGCRGAGAPAAAPPIANDSTAPAGTGPWQLDGDVVGAADHRLFVWDRAWHGETGGLAERSTADGALIRTREIAGLPMNGGLRYWEPVPGGYLAHWDAPAFVTERGGALAVAWSAPGGDWFDYHVVVDGALVVSRSRDVAGVVRLSLADGHEEWRAPLVRWSQDVTVATDGTAIYTTWQEYDPNAPTPTVVMARRVRALALATGATLWTRDFAVEPGALAVTRGTIIAAVGGELQFLDGATGAVGATVPLGPPNVYPGLLVDGDRVIVANDRTVRALTLTGEPLWQAEVQLDGGPELAVVGDEVLVTTAAATVVALARATGERRWEVGVGVRPYRLWTTPSAVVGTTSSFAVGFALPPGAPAESARVHGRVASVGCGEVAATIVMIGGTRVSVDVHGDYRATVVARGFLTVSVLGASPMQREGVGSVVIRLDGHGDYPVPDLTPQMCDME